MNLFLIFAGHKVSLEACLEDRFTEFLLFIFVLAAFKDEMTNLFPSLDTLSECSYIIASFPPYNPPPPWYMNVPASPFMTVVRRVEPPQRFGVVEPPQTYSNLPCRPASPFVTVVRGLERSRL